jgi:hypothetical protein
MQPQGRHAAPRLDFFRSVGAAALVVLQNISRVPRTDYVFLAEIGNGHYQGMNRLWGKAIKKAALSG